MALFPHRSLTVITYCVGFILACVAGFGLVIGNVTAATASGQCCYCTTESADGGEPLEIMYDPAEKSPDQTAADCTAFESDSADVSTTCELKQEACPSGSTVRPITPPQPAVTIPGLKPLTPELELDDTETFYRVPWIAEYISAIYKFGVGVAVVLAIVMIVFGGFVWMTAGGNANQVTTAKGYIIGAISGVVLALGSYSILYLVNPNLTRLSSITVPYIKNVPLEIGPRQSLSLLANPGKVGQKDQFNAAPCPTKEEAQQGFNAFLTAYYAPPYGQKGPWKSFECNVAMQCSCPGPGGNKYHKDTSQTCGFPPSVLKGNFSDNPCVSFPATTPFCQDGTYGAVTAFKTAAADVTTQSQCWTKGDTFIVEGIGGQLSGPWTVGDQGSDIKGRHFDLFVGSDLNSAQNIGGVYKVKFTKCKKCGF